MKKLIGLSMSFLMVLFSTISNAQEIKKVALNSEKNGVKESKMERKEIREEDRNLVSDMSINAFYADFGNIPNVRWEKDNLFDIAIFKKDGKQYKAYYDSSSKLVGTITSKTFADLPMDAQKQIKKEYKNYTIDKVDFFKDNENYDSSYDQFLYGMQFENADNYFVELSNKAQKTNIVLQVTPEGDIFFLKELNKA